ncbi:MAG: hypothetical protein AB8F95_11510 [Bacteroidia bacterium]
MKPEPNKKSPDILRTDIGFLEFAGSLLFGLGIISLVFRLLCGLFAVKGLCLPGFFPFPVLEYYFKPGFFAYVLPLSMVILGIGLGMFSRTGWFAAQFILLFYLVFFGFSVVILGQGWANMGSDFPYSLAFVLHFVIAAWALIFILYLALTSTRQLYRGYHMKEE